MSAAAGRGLRIGVVAACDFPSPRGSQVLIDGLATALQATGAATHLIAPVFGREIACSYARHRLFAHHERRPAKGRWSGGLARACLDAALVARLHAVVRRERLHALHAHNYEGLAAALAVGHLCRIPVVYHSHNLLADELPTYAAPHFVGFARRLGAWCDRRLPRRAAHVVALSADVRDHLVRCGVASERVSLVPPGIDATPFTASPGPTRRRRAVFSGNLDRYQNLDLLLDAFALCAARDPRAGLTLVSHTPSARLRREVQRRGLGDSVELVLARSLADVAAQLRSAAVGVSPRTSWSGYPMKTLNYMASALPTVAVAASAKGVSHGETGWVVPDASAAGLADALCTAFSEEGEAVRRGRRAREAALTAHRWERLAPRVIDATLRALDSPAS